MKKDRPNSHSGELHHRRPQLLILRLEARGRIHECINNGKELLSRTIESEEALEQFRREMKSWTDFNTELLSRIFDAEEYAEEYSRYPGGTVYRGMSLSQRIMYHRKMLEEYVRRLGSLDDRLDLISEVPRDRLARAVEARPALAVESSRKVFVVHGRNVEVKESVARFLEKLDLEPIILHEQANLGQTIIEKFEVHSEVRYALVLLTPDDIGAAMADRDNLSPRPRQNVVFELGYFVGKLGRRRVCALYVPDIELPSDWNGVLYIPFDEGGGWKLKLAREIKAAGIDIDLNEAV